MFLGHLPTPNILTVSPQRSGVVIETTQKTKGNRQWAFFLDARLAMSLWHRHTHIVFISVRKLMKFVEFYHQFQLFAIFLIRSWTGLISITCYSGDLWESHAMSVVSSEDRGRSLLVFEVRGRNNWHLSISHFFNPARSMKTIIFS